MISLAINFSHTDGISWARPYNENSTVGRVIEECSRNRTRFHKWQQYEGLLQFDHAELRLRSRATNWYQAMRPIAR